MECYFVIFLQILSISSQGMADLWGMEIYGDLFSQTELEFPIPHKSAMGNFRKNGSWQIWELKS